MAARYKLGLICAFLLPIALWGIAKRAFLAEKFEALRLSDLTETIDLPAGAQYLASLLPVRRADETPPELDLVPAEITVPVTSTDRGGKILLKIAEDARDTLPVFFRHFLRPEKDESCFRVKYPFRADSGFGMEQLWLRNIRFQNGVYYGVIANTPRYAAGLRKGDPVMFNAGEITDWMYIKNGKITGGLSIKYLLEQIPAPERGEEQRALLKMF